MRNRILTLTAATAVMLCAAATASASPRPAPSTNARGAIEVALGQPVTVTGPDGALVLAVTDTRLSADRCAPNLTDPAHIAKQAFTARIRTGAQTNVRWLWSTDIYFVDMAGKVTRDSTTGDGVLCDTDTSDNFLNLPPNSAATGSVTLDIPRGTRFIGYHTSLYGPVSVEWRLRQPIG